jgi:TRAP-type C4-dicarboxylate transport system permease small subunit
MAMASTRFQNGFIPNYASIFFFGVLLLTGWFVLIPKMSVLIPSLGIYSTVLLQIIPVLLVILTWDLAFSNRKSGI